MEALGLSSISNHLLGGRLLHKRLLSSDEMYYSSVLRPHWIHLIHDHGKYSGFLFCENAPAFSIST